MVLTQQTGRRFETCDESFGFPVCRFAWAGLDKPLSTLKLPGDMRLVMSVLIRGMLTAFRCQKSFAAGYVLALWAIPSGLWAVALKWIFGIPYVVWCLGSDVWDYTDNPIRRFFLRSILRNASARFADGLVLCEDVRKVSEMGCDFLPSSRNLPVSSAASARLDPGKYHFLFIGRYHPNKGPDVLLNAVQKLPRQTREKIFVHLFGGGPLYDQLNKMVTEHDLCRSVQVNGFIEPETAAQFLKSVGALIIPSRIESIPVILSDALQADAPIIATDVGDMGYLLKQYHAGIVVPPKDPEALARAMEDQLGSADCFGDGRKQLLKLFKISTAAERLLNVLNTVSTH
jgi:glycosyltransferase involved in cell wall biosynthesis